MSNTQQASHDELPLSAHSANSLSSSLEGALENGHVLNSSEQLVADVLPVDAEEENEPSVGWVILRELTETIVLSLIIFLLMRQVVQNYRIESHSMEPNFTEGQFILVNKLAYVLGQPERGDVLVFHNPGNHDEDYIKRIIG
ncbi:MAG: signal peptidase I, partial [Caldilineaceae bacterium]|nr:signal peptidase I [Caldilineaceae bacterium]